MRKSLAVLGLLFCVHWASAYTVVLKSGKKIEGAVVVEDETTIQIKDDDGVILRLNKKSVDEDATSAANPGQTQSRPSTQTHDSKSSPVEDAKKTQDHQTPGSRVFTNKDIKDMPEVSILGSSDSPENPEFDYESEGGKGPSETFWRAAAIRLRQKKAIAEERCRRVRNKPAFATEKAPECPLMQEVEKQVEDFREEARRRNVPPYWISDLDE